MDINAIERILDKRASRGASDASLIGYLEELKTIHKEYHNDIDGLIDAIKQTPLRVRLYVQHNDIYAREIIIRNGFVCINPDDAGYLAIYRKDGQRYKLDGWENKSNVMSDKPNYLELVSV